jgi:serine/threonine-protein kinase RsbW
MKSEITIGSEIGNLRKIEEFIESVSSRFAIGKEAYGEVLVAVMEAVNNAINHGNGRDERKKVDVCFEKEGEKLIVIITDEGKGFKPESIPDPTKPENIENISGRGVFLMRKLSDSIEFNKTGNSVKMSFNLNRN